MASAGYCTARKELNFLRNLIDRNESIEHAKQSQSRDLALSGKLKQAMCKSTESKRRGRAGLGERRRIDDLDVYGMRSPSREQYQAVIINDPHLCSLHYAELPAVV